MLPGKKYTLEDILQILRRRIWVILVPLAVVSAATALAVRQLPNRFRSETVILVVPQRIPEIYVKPTVTARIEDRLQSIRQQILSRTRLERIIHDFDLYAAQRRTEAMEMIVEHMRTEISVQVVKGDAFRIAYAGDNARTVMHVTNRLASLFIEENLHDREVLAEGTNQFLDAQLDEARRRLVEHEKKLEEYRRRFSGELPSQLASNLQVSQNIQTQLQALVESINRDRDRRLMIERQTAEAERESETARLTAGTATAPAAVANLSPLSGTAYQELVAAQAELSAMERRLKPEHPDVIRMHSVVRDLEAKAAAEAGIVSAAEDPAPVPISPAELARQERVAEMRAELRQLDHQLAAKEAENERLQSEAVRYQQRIEMVPTRVSQLTELMRDYSTLQTMYSSLLSKREESTIAADLERRQVGEQFKLLDPARVAERPFAPNRQRMIAIGAAAGLALGIGLIALLEYRDRSFRTDSEVVKELALPVLVVVPLMESDTERQWTFRRRLLVGCSLGTIVAASMAIVASTFLG